MFKFFRVWGSGLMAIAGVCLESDDVEEAETL